MTGKSHITYWGKLLSIESFKKINLLNKMYMKMVHRLQFVFTTKIFCEKGKELEKMKAKCSEVVSFEALLATIRNVLKAKTNFIFLLLPWPYR